MFKPSLHGWGFADAFTVDGPALGLGAAPDRFGLGGGMCWAALDRYLDGRLVPDLASAPGQETPLHAEILQRQVAALADVWPRLRQWQALPDGSWRDRLPLSLTPGKHDVTSLTRAGWRTLRRSLAAGRPILLTLVRPDDGYTRATAARQVLACGFETSGGNVVLSIYDPTRPGDDDVRLAFSRRGPLDARLTGGERVRGFFAVPYDREPAACIHAESFADRAVVGLNRKVRGAPRAAPGRRGLHIVARDGDGALIHFHRRNGKPWESANITEREQFGVHELHCDPAPITGPGGIGLHVFARSYVGDLLHFRALRRWRVANRTDDRRAGARFRLGGEPQPVALPWGGFCVVARGGEGSLVAYSGAPFRGIRAEEVPPPAGGVIDGDPAVVSIGPVVHALARGRNGHLLHFERTRGGWSAGDLVTLCEAAEPVRGRPVLIVHEGSLHAFARTTDGRLLHLARGGDGQWSGEVAADGVEGDPAVTTGPAGLHAFAAGLDGGVVHAWRSADQWRVEDVVRSRAASRGSPSPSEGLVAWGSRSELRLFGRRDGALVHWVWRPDTDWVGGPILEHAGVAERHQPGEDALLARDHGGGFHLFATNGRGTVLHLESGSWQAPSTRVRGTGLGTTPVVGEEEAEAATAGAGRDADFELDVGPPPPAGEAAPEPEPVLEWEPESGSALEVESILEPTQPESLVEPESLIEPESLLDPESLVEPESLIEPEPLLEPESLIEPEPLLEPESLVEPEPAAELELLDVESLLEPESAGEGVEAAEAPPPSESQPKLTVVGPKRVPVPPSDLPPLLEDIDEPVFEEADAETDLPPLASDSGEDSEPFAWEVPAEAEAADDSEPFAWEVPAEAEAAEDSEPFAWEVPAEPAPDAKDDSPQVEGLNLEHMESWPTGPTRPSKKRSGGGEAESAPPWPEES